MEHKYLCLSCYMEQREVYSVEPVNVPPLRRACEGCGRKCQVWKYLVKRKAVRKVV